MGNADYGIIQWDPLFATAKDGEPYDKREYGGQMRECAEACLALCNDIDAVNDFVVCLMSGVYTLQSYYEGDASEFDSGPYESIENWILPKEDQVSNCGGDTAV